MQNTLKRFSTSAHETSGRKPCDVLERLYIQQQQPVDSLGASPADMYAQCVEEWPALAKRSLYECYAADVHEALVAVDLEKLETLADVLVLRSHLYETLSLNNAPMQHIVDYECSASWSLFMLCARALEGEFNGVSQDLHH